MNKKSKIICAIDTPSIQNALHIANEISENIAMIKLGLEFFIANGKLGIIELSKLGIPIFLDLKLHDIPNTVSKAISSLPEKTISFLTVHVSGGKDMLKMALKSAKEKQIKLIGVTVLTSLENKVETTLNNVISMAKIASDCGIEHIVCSALEVQKVKNTFPQLITIVPGIRNKEDKQHDQSRVSTPRNAIQLGADYIVIGRPITESENPNLSAKKILESISDL